MPKRVLFAIDGLGGGGAERVVTRLAGHLARRGHWVELALLRDERVIEVPEGVGLIAAYDDAPRSLRKLAEVRRRARILDACLEGRDRWDLVVSTLAQTDRIVSRSSLADAAWYRIAAHPGAEHLERHGRFRRWRRKRRLRRTYGGRRVLTVSAGIARDLERSLGIRPERLATIPNPFDIDGIRSLAAEPCDLAGEAYLLYVGRFETQKRLDRLLGGVARSSWTGRVVLLGGGTEAQREAVRTQVREAGLAARVELRPWHPNPYPWMRHARALLLASDFEGFPNVLVEALICGTPAVATRCPSGPDEILTGDLAVGLAELSEESFAATIDRVTEDPPAIPAAVVERYAIASVAGRYLELAG